MKTREEALLKWIPMNSIGAELGVFEGSFSDILWSTKCFKKLYLVDIFEGLMYSGDKNGNNGKTINLNTAYNELINRYSNNKDINIIKSTTELWLQSLNDNVLDFVYIDADHSYKGVIGDLELSRNKVRNDGIISGHDYNNDMFPGVVQAVNEFISKYNLQLHLTTDDKLASYFITNKK